MRRDDFSEAEQRELAWQRRKVCHAVGQAHDRMIDAGHDPSEDMEWMVRWLLRRVEAIEAVTADLKDAA